MKKATDDQLKKFAEHLKLTEWVKMSEKPDGTFCRVQWQNGKFPAWRIIEQGTESGGTRFIVVCTSGSAFGRGFDTFKAAQDAFTQGMEKYL